MRCQYKYLYQCVGEYIQGASHYEDIDRGATKMWRQESELDGEEEVYYS